MAIKTGKFRVAEGSAVDLAERPTRVPPLYGSDAEYRAMLLDHVRRLSRQQTKLYADNRFALLLIFQAMDGAGKDGAIKHVMSGVNPQGCQVFSYKHPSAIELQHDFLWRTTRDLPERGKIGIFNRSYYEEVLIVRVHPNLLAAEAMPDADSGKLWAHRFRSIRALERHLHENGTVILKFFLHLSRQEQLSRLLARLDDPAKNWKISPSDLDERPFWDDYMAAYAACLGATSTKHSPWYVVPADDKRNARLIVSDIVVKTLRKRRLAYPAVEAGVLEAARARLLGE